MPGIKTEFNPLLKKGLHLKTLKELEDLTCFTRHREDRFSLLIKFLNHISAIIKPYTVWIDGSFLTEKPNPKDIDCVLVFNETSINNLDPIEFSELMIVQNRVVINSTFGVDLYYFNEVNAVRYQYWLNQFGTFRDNTTDKGIVRIDIK